MEKTLVESYPLLTLAPPLLAIVLAILTRKVLISLGIGVLSAALLVADFDLADWLSLVWEAFSGIFWDESAVNTFYVYILIFTLLLGVIAAFVLMSGGTQAFADWAIDRIENRRGAVVLPAILGMVLFIDDYFNALTVGQVSRPVTDAHKASRGKRAVLAALRSRPTDVSVVASSVKV